MTALPASLAEAARLIAAKRVSPVLGLTVTKNSHGPSAGFAAAAIEAAPGLLIGPGGSPCTR